jgi:hypothetical protein
VSAVFADPFAVDPIRRSFGVVVICGGVVVGPWLASREVGETVMVTVGWLALTGLIFGVPVLVWSLTEEAVKAVQRRRHPTIDQLELSPRVAHILQRFGYRTIASAEAAPDAELLLLSNMDARGLREIRRAIALRHYRRWQERGFPVEATR